MKRRSSRSALDSTAVVLPMAAAPKASNDERVLAVGTIQAAARAAAVRRFDYSGRLERGWPRSGPPKNRSRVFRRRSNQRSTSAWRHRTERGRSPEPGASLACAASFASPRTAWRPPSQPLHRYQQALAARAGWPSAARPIFVPPRAGTYPCSELRRAETSPSKVRFHVADSAGGIAPLAEPCGVHPRERRHRGHHRPR